MKQSKNFSNKYSNNITIKNRKIDEFINLVENEEEILGNKEGLEENTYKDSSSFLESTNSSNTIENYNNYRYQREEKRDNFINKRDIDKTKPKKDKKEKKHTKNNNIDSYFDKYSYEQRGLGLTHNLEDDDEDILRQVLEMSKNDK